MKQCCFLFIVLIIVIFPISTCLKYSKSTITGKVTDHVSGKPIPNAIVHERSHGKLRVRTDAQGNFRLEGIYSEEHNIYVSVRGYRLTVKNSPNDARKEKDGYVLHLMLDPA